MLPNCNILRTLELTFFWNLISENLPPPLILDKNLSKRCHFFKNTTPVEIIMKINSGNCTHIRAKFFVILNENCSTKCYCNFNPCGIFEKMSSFTQIFNLRLGTRKINGGRKFNWLGNKDPKNVSFNVLNRLKFGKIFRNVLLCTKMKKKMNIENLIIVAL